MDRDVFVEKEATDESERDDIEYHHEYGSDSYPLMIGWREKE